jgi:hypothetical protein
MWWAISHEGIIATYGSTALPPKAHHDGHSTPVVGVNRSPDYPKSIILVTASGSRWIVDENVERSTPPASWRGLATRMVQISRKAALKEGKVIGVGCTMTLAERVAWQK